MRPLGCTDSAREACETSHPSASHFLTSLPTPGIASGRGEIGHRRHARAGFWPGHPDESEIGDASEW
jgi:hypothetical protein